MFSTESYGIATHPWIALAVAIGVWLWFALLVAKVKRDGRKMAETVKLFDR